MRELAGGDTGEGIGEGLLAHANKEGLFGGAERGDGEGGDNEESEANELSLGNERVDIALSGSA